MVISQREIKGVFEIQMEPKRDNRGFFMKTYDDATFEKFSLNKTWLQEYRSFSKEKHTLRGLHLQLEPFAETKMIQVISGEIFDVFVDLRKDSATFGKWGSAILSEENKKMMYIPRGFAHAFLTLTENTQVLCKMDNYYSFEAEKQIAYNDPDLHIQWPLSLLPILSKKDAQAMSLKEFIKTCT